MNWRGWEKKRGTRGDLGLFIPLRIADISKKKGE
jgi:hypothetical protein